MTAEGVMRKTTKYTGGEIGRVRVVEDFLPSAKKLTKRKSKAVAKGTAKMPRPSGR
jgi:hypothetical protein